MKNKIYPLCLSMSKQQAHKKKEFLWQSLRLPANYVIGEKECACCHGPAEKRCDCCMDEISTKCTISCICGAYICKSCKEEKDCCCIEEL